MPKYHLRVGERRELHGILCENFANVAVTVWFLKTHARAGAAILIGEDAWTIQAQSREHPITCTVMRHPLTTDVNGLQFKTFAPSDSN